MPSCGGEQHLQKEVFDQFNAMQWVNDLPKTNRTSDQQLWHSRCHWPWTVCKQNVLPILLANNDRITNSWQINALLHTLTKMSHTYTTYNCHFSEIVSQDLWWSVFLRNVLQCFTTGCNLWQFWEQFGAILDDSGWVRSTPHSLHRFQMDLWFVFKWICDHGFRFPSTINCREWEQKVRRDDDTTVNFD